MPLQSDIFTAKLIFWAFIGTQDAQCVLAEKDSMCIKCKATSEVLAP